MERAIITGATGAVGSALIQKLISNNIEVLVFCREGSKRNIQIPENPLVTKKFCSLNELADIQNDTGKNYDVFYHFAWQGTIGSARNDVYLQNENVRYALDAVAAAKRFGCHTFIGAGSQAEYGRYEGILRPDTPVFPETGYGIGKLCAGQMTREYAHQLGLKHIWTRILSVYGPYDGPATMISGTVRKLLQGEKPSLTAGVQLWDYLYSADAADAFYALAVSGKDGKIYPLGSGTARPLKSYIETLRDAIDPALPLGLGEVPYGPLQVMHLQADTTALREDTGWQPATPFEEGIRKTIEWIRKDAK